MIPLEEEAPWLSQCPSAGKQKWLFAGKKMDTGICPYFSEQTDIIYICPQAKHQQKQHILCRSWIFLIFQNTYFASKKVATNSKYLNHLENIEPSLSWETQLFHPLSKT